MPTNEENFEEVLGPIPTRKWKLGIVLVILMIAIIAAIAWWLDYRSAVEVPLQIFTENKSLDIRSNQEGQIANIWIKDGDKVQQDTPLFLFKNQANWTDLKALKNWLKADQTNPIPNGKHGPLASTVDQITALSTKLKIFQSSGTEQQAYWITQSNDSLQKIDQNIQVQITLIKKDVQIAKTNYEEYKTLFQTGSASRLEVNNAESRWLHYRQNLESKIQESKKLGSDILLQKGQASRLLSSKSEQTTLLEAEINSKKQQLLHQIENWQEQYLFKAPQSGTIHFTQAVQTGDYISKGQLVAKIVSQEKSPYQAEGFLTAHRSGEVKIGNEVLLQVNAYPYRKFGQLEGRVSAIGQTFTPGPAGGGIRIIITLEKGLTTTQNKALIYKDGMPALGRIIVE